MPIRVWLSLGVLLSVLNGTAADTSICEVSPSYAFYEVSGSSTDELEAALRTRGPRDESGARRFAYTDWTVRWEWRRFEDGAVDPSTVSLACVATILLPRVKDIDSLSPDLRNSWNSFIERTRQHELRHVSHVENTAPQIVQRIRDEHQRVGGVSLKRAKAIVRDVIAEIKAEDRRYDAETDHGRTEGTWKILR